MKTNLTQKHKLKNRHRLTAVLFLFFTSILFSPNVLADITVIFEGVDDGFERCQTTFFSVNLDASGGSGGYTFTITDDPDNLGQIIFGNILVLDFSTPGTYYIEVTATDIDMNSGSGILNFTVLPAPPKPTIDVIGDLEFCDGGSVTLRANESIYEYQWLRGGTAIAGATEREYVATISGSYRVKLINTDNGCESTSDPTVVTVHPNPSPVPSIDPNPVCEDEAVQFDVDMGGHVAAITSYEWTDPDDAFFSDLKDPVIANVALDDAGIYTINVIDDNTCEGSANIELFVDPLPIAPDEALVDRNDLCAEDDGDITLSATGGSPHYGHTLRWYTDGCGITHVGDGNNLVLPAPDVTTTYFALYESDDCGQSACADVTVNVYDPMDGGEIADDQDICHGTIPAPFTDEISPTGGFGAWTYSWEYSTDGLTWNPIAGTNSLEYEVVDPLTVTTYYQRVAENSCGIVTSNVIEVIVYDEMDGGEIEEDQQICYNTLPDPFTNVEAPTGGTGAWTYSWEYSVNGVDWTPIAGTNNLEYTIADPLTVTTYYQRVAENVCGIVTSNIIEVFVYDEMDSGEIEDDQEICYNTLPDTFNNVVAPSGGTGTWTYSWEYSVNGIDWTPLPGSNSLDYTVTDPLITTTFYQRVAENDCGIVTSNIITITVYDDIDGGEIEEDQGICYNDIPSDITESIPPSGGEPGVWSFEWEYREEGEADWTIIAGENNPDLIFVSGVTITTEYRRLSINLCGSVYSNIVTITVTDELSPGEIAENQSICFGSIPEAITSISGGSGGTGVDSYQWRYRDEGGVWDDILGANDEEYEELANLFETRYYKRVFSNDCGSVISNIIQVEVYGELDAAINVTHVTGCFGNENGIIDITDPEGGSGDYQYSIDGGTSWHNSGYFDGLSAGFYNVQIRDSNLPDCFIVLDPNLEIEQPEELSADLDWQNVTECHDAENGWIEISNPDGGSGDYEYTIDGGSSWHATGLFEDLGLGTYNVQIRDANHPDCIVILNDNLILTAPDTLGVDDVVKQDVTCAGGNNGEIEIINPFGGSGNFEFSIDIVGDIWQAGLVFDDLFAGEYEVYIRDADFPDCISLLAVINIEEPDPLTADVDHEDVTCHGYDDGQIIITNPEGGSGNYQFSINGTDWFDWTPDELVFEDLEPDFYDVFIRDTEDIDCFVLLETIEITQPGEIIIDVFTTDVDCWGEATGDAFAVVVGGTGPYYFTWEDDFGNIIDEGEGVDFIDELAAGTYHVFVEDANGCINSKTFIISEPASPLWVTAGPSVTICSGINDGIWELGGTGGTATADGGEPPYTYLWSSEPYEPSLYVGDQHETANPIVSPNQQTVYTITVTDSYGCVKTRSATISTHPIVIADAGGDADGFLYVCEGSDVTLGGTPNTAYYQDDPFVDPEQFSYFWQRLDGASWVFFSTNSHPTVTPTETTTYRVRARDESDESDDCIAYDTVTVVVWDPIIVETIPDDDICHPNNNGTGITLGATITPPAPAEGTYEYLWVADPHDLTLEGQENDLEPFVSPLVTTTYTLYVNATAGIGCDGSDEVVITVHPEIVADAGDDGVLCDPATETYTLGGSPTARYFDGSPGIFTYLWTADPPDPTLVDDDIANPEVAPTETTTYTLTVWDDNGCFEVDEITITVAPVTLAATIVPDVVDLDCFGDVHVAEVDVVGGILPYIFEWSPAPIDQTDNEATLAAGDYTVTVTDDLGCQVFASILITEPDELIIDVAFNDPSGPGAVDGDITVEVTQSTFPDYQYILYIWDEGISDWDQIDIEITAGITHTFTGLDVGNYRIEVIDDNGCIAEDFVTLSVLDLEIAWTNITCYDACDGTITLTLTGHIASIDWFKDGDPYDMIPHIDPEEADYHYIDLCPGFYEVFVEDDYGNDISGSATISEPDEIVIDDESVFYTEIICHGANDGEISLIALGGTGDIYYTLYEDGVVDPVAGPQTNDGNFTGLSPAAYYVEITDDMGCGPVVSDLLTIEELDDTFAGDNVTICYEQSVQLGPNVEVPGMIYEWTSDPEDLSISNPDIFNPWVSPGVTTTYTLWEEYPDAGCFNSAEVVVTVEGEYVSEETYEICMYSDIEIGKESIPDYEYEWVSSNPDEEIDDETSFITVLPMTTTTYTLREYIPDTEGLDDKACYNVYDFIVLVNPNPKADAGPNREMCLGEPIVIGGDYSGPLPASEFLWTTEDPDVYISDPTIANPLVSPTVTTTFTFKERYIETGCVDSNTVIVKVFPEFEAQADNTGPYCEGTTIELSSGPDGYDYHWTGPDGWESSEQNPERPDATVNMAGVYTVTISGEFGETGLECNITAETEVEIYELPVPLVADDYFFCSPDVFINPVPIGGEEIDGYTYLWESDPEDPDLVDDIANPFVKPEETTVYTLRVTNEYGCANFADVKVEISDFALDIGERPSVCEDEQIVYIGENIEVSGGLAPYTYTWTNINGNIISTIRNPSIYRPFDPYYILSVGDAQDCYITDNVFINDIQSPVVELTAEPTSTPLPGQLITFIATPGNYHKYDFYIDNELKQSDTINEYQTSELINGQRVWVVVSYFGCEGISNVITIIIRDLPNAFIPDEGALPENRIFGEGVQMVVFNRWGQKIYEGNKGWDGTYKGRRVAPGTYYYVATVYGADGKKTELPGSVTVVIPSQ